MKVERPRARSSAAPTRLNSWSTTPISRRRRRHERAHLRQHRDQRVLPQVGRLAGHVRPGDQPERPRLRPVGAERRCRWRRSCRPTAAAPARPPDAARRRYGTPRPSPTSGRTQSSAAREVGERRPRRRSRPAPSRSTPIAPARASTAARRSSKIRRSISSAWPPAFRIFVSISASASVVKRIALGRGLAVHEELGERRLQHPLGMRRRRLDEVAEHVVVLDLQRARRRSAARTRPAARRSRRAPGRAAAGSRRAPRRSPPPRSRRRAPGAAARPTSAASSRPTSSLMPGERALRRRQHLGQLARRAPAAAARPGRARRGSPRGRAARRGRAPAATAPARGPAPGAAARAPPAPRRGASTKCATASCRARTSRTSVDGPFSRVSRSRAPAPVTRPVDRGEQRARRARRRGCGSARGCAGSPRRSASARPAPSRTGGRSSGSRPRWVSSR